MSVQISAYIAEGVKEKMERLAASRGLKKGYMIEQALLHYLDALEGLPQSQIVPATITVSQEAMDSLLQLQAREPNDRLKALMRED